jgi:hypothetical protein
MHRPMRAGRCLAVAGTVPGTKEGMVDLERTILELREELRIVDQVILALERLGARERNKQHLVSRAAAVSNKRAHGAHAAPAAAADS